MDHRFGSFLLKRRERQLSGPDGPVDLGARSFDILCLLLDRPGEVVGKDEILARVWPGVVVEENTLQVHVSGLRKVLGPSSIVTVHGRGYKYAGPAPTAEGERPPATKPESRPVVVVLPFDNLGGDPDQQYFSDGISEDIIDRLARYRGLAVIGANTSAAMRGRNEELDEIRKRLAADYLVTGNVRRAPQRIRIAARLTDTRTGAVVWADHYDRPIDDIFAVQDEVAAVIAGSLQGHVEVSMVQRPGNTGRDITSYEMVLRGIAYFKELSPSANSAAAHCFEQAIATNPSNAEAYRWLSSCRINDWFIEYRRERLRDAIALARHAVTLDPANARCHTALGFPQLWEEGLDAATHTYARARACNPEDPHMLAELGLLNVYRGDQAAALACLDRAVALNPVPPLWYAEFRAISDFVKGRYAAALPAFAAIPHCQFDTAYAVACLVHLGDRSELSVVMGRVRQAGWDLLAVAEHEPFDDPEPRTRLIESIGLALKTH